MAEVIELKKQGTFRIVGSLGLLRKYKLGGKELTVYLTDGKKFTGQLRWYDNYALKIILPDESITIPIHNIVQYECEHFLSEGEVEYKGKVSRGIAFPTNREKEQISKYKKNKELLHFYLKDGTEVRGRLQWVLEYVYAVRPDNSNHDFMITKRHIMYYRKIEVN
jgi:sRNA-binding regulator protein Hfq